MKSFFLVYRNNGWTPSNVATLATEYGKYGKNVEIVEDEPSLSLLIIDDMYSSAVPFLFRHLLGITDNVAFLYTEPFTRPRRGHIPVAHMTLTPGSMSVETYDGVADKELILLGAPSTWVRELLEKDNLVLKRVAVPDALDAEVGDGIGDPEEYVRKVARRMGEMFERMPEHK